MDALGVEKTLLHLRPKPWIRQCQSPRHNVAYHGSDGPVLDGAAPQLLPAPASWCSVYDNISYGSLDHGLYGGVAE
jgi:hypothetical protein